MLADDDSLSRRRVVARLNSGFRRLIRLRTTSIRRVKLLATAPIAALLTCGVQAAHPATSATLRDPACPNINLRVVRAEDGADQSVERFFGQLLSLAPHLTWRSARGSFTGRITRNASGEQRVVLLAARDFQELAYEP